MSGQWYAIMLLGTILAFYVVRRWIAFRPVVKLSKKRSLLGNPIDQTRAEVETILGPPTNFPEGTEDEQILVWYADGTFSVLGAYEVTRYAVCTLRFENGICTEDISEEKARSVGPEDVQAQLDQLVSSGWRIVGVRMKRNWGGLFRGNQARVVLSVELEQEKIKKREN